MRVPAALVPATSPLRRRCSVRPAWTSTQGRESAACARAGWGWYSTAGLAVAKVSSSSGSSGAGRRRMRRRQRRTKAGRRRRLGQGIGWWRWTACGGWANCHETSSRSSSWAPRAPSPSSRSCGRAPEMRSRSGWSVAGAGQAWRSPRKRCAPTVWPAAPSRPRRRASRFRTGTPLDPMPKGLGPAPPGPAAPAQSPARRAGRES
mmetsp:Transcript_73802/g.196424  ORF Transcript_73802/g.196424 Transcript_73802/m.196424 type:complete len:205 (-) Transcript_73802:539-1153(-)